MTTRRDFLKHSALGAAGLTIGGLGFSTESFANIMAQTRRFVWVSSAFQTVPAIL